MNVNANVNVKKIGRGGKRRALGWTLLTLGLLVAAVWGASGWWSASWSGPGFELYARHGTAYLVRSEGAVGVSQPHATRVDELPSTSRGWDWWARTPRMPPQIGSNTDLGIVAFAQARPPSAPGPLRLYAVQFWPLGVVCGVGGTVLVRSGILAWRRAMTGMCRKCGYSLAGLAADAPCPECGKQKTSHG